LNFRAHWAGAALRPWQFPELEAPASQDQVSLPAESDLEIATAEINEDLAIHEERSTREIVAEQIASGYADGFERGLSDGKERGYADGLEAGTQAGKKSLAAEARRLRKIVARLGAPIPALEPVVEEAVAALALEVARCVIGSEITRSRDYLVRLIREAIAKIPIETGDLRVILNPADMELMRTLAPEIESGSACLVGDESIEPGGCLVVADGQGTPIKDMRWQSRTSDSTSQVDLTLASRWRSVMLTLFEGEDK
jgi:flagellar assembly protein FliH